MESNSSAPGQMATRIVFRSAEDIGAAFSAMPAKGAVEVMCPARLLTECLMAMEKTGFFGMLVTQAATGETSISAHKGKESPCYETGRSASLLPPALAVVDDDKHVIFGTLRVCEKTSTIYSLPRYARWIKVSDPDSALMARLATDPVPFDCNTFDRDTRALHERLAHASSSETKSVPVLYPGPFRLVVLRDGSMLPRGQAVLISASVFPDATTIGCWKMDDASRVRKADLYQDLYKRAGAAGILASQVADGLTHQTGSVDLTEIANIPQSTRQLLRKVISGRDPYFVLTGTDPDIPGGCCPSTDVGASNRLVRAGILQSWGGDVDGDACPTTIYAFRDEIRTENNRPVFSVNEPFRRTVESELENPGRARIPIWIKAVRTVLAVFVLSALFYGIATQLLFTEGTTQVADLPLPALAAEDSIVLYIFHSASTCEACTNMKKLTAEAIQTYFPQESQSGRIRIVHINYDLPENQHLKKQYGVYTSSVMAVLYRQRREQSRRLLTEAWRLYRSQKEFTEMIRNEVTALLAAKP